MVDLDDLQRRARRAAELGRLRMAARIGLVILPVACASLLGGAAPGACACLAGLLLGLTMGLRWWHREGVQAVNLGMGMGVVPLFAALALRACGVDCAPWIRFTEADLVCIMAGVLAGMGVALRATSGGYGARVWAWATLVASATATLGCVGLGVGGVLATVFSLVGSSALVWVPMRARLA